MVDFAGWEMPVQYARHPRGTQGSAGGLRDFRYLSHGRVPHPGPRSRFMAWIRCLRIRVTKLEEGQAQYSLLLNRAWRHHRRSHRLPNRSAGISADCQCRENRRRLRLAARPHSRPAADDVALSYQSAAMPMRPWPSKDPGRRRFSRKYFLFRGSSAEIASSEFGDEPARDGNSTSAGTLRSFVATTGYTGELGFEVARSRG